VQGKVSLWLQLGAEPKPPTALSAKDAPPPPPPKPRPMIYGFVTITARIDDRLVLRPGQPELDLLGGDTLDGTGGRPRYEAQGNLGGSLGPVQGGFYAQWQGPTRIRSDIATSDLRFSAKSFVGLYTTIDAARLAPRAAWTKKVTFQLNVQNIFNDRIAVRDRNGIVPYRFQPAFLDPYGRIVRLTVRKLF
jgi:iron complex outermembrane receptor protein